MGSVPFVLPEARDDIYGVPDSTPARQPLPQRGWIRIEREATSDFGRQPTRLCRLSPTLDACSRFAYFCFCFENTPESATYGPGNRALRQYAPAGPRLVARSR